MANLILASKREVKSGAQMWHVYQHENGAKVAESEFYFALPYKALRYAFMLRKRTGAVIPTAIYNKLMADVSASKAQAKPSAAQESAPEASEPSALAKAYESMKAKHPDAILLYRCGDFYESFGEDAKAVSDVLWASPSLAQVARTSPHNWQVSPPMLWTRIYPVSLELVSE